MKSKDLKHFPLTAIAVCLLGTAASSTFAADTPAAGSSDNSTTLQQVIVTGTRQKRSASKSASPIDVINASDLAKTGAGNITDALNDLLPSFNLPTVTGYDQSAVVRPANLRGLNGDQTLVLVNGKHRHASAIVNVNAYVNRGSEPVDLNTIPFNMVDHIEVLRDGAAAQYGSDAIAGVINIILKSDQEGGESSAKVGGYDFQDGLTFQTGITKAWQLGQNGFFDLSLEHFSQNHTDRSGPTPPNDGHYYFLLPDGSADPREATVDPYGLTSDGLPDTRNYNIGYNGALPLGDDLTIYSFSTYSFKHAKGYEYFRYANSGSDDPTWGYTGPGSPYTQSYDNGYEPLEVIDENDFSVTAGVKGKSLFGWAWDLSTTYGKDDASVSVVNTLNPTLGPTSPHAFYAGSWINAEQTTTLDFTRSFDIGLASPLATAWGLEHRNDTYALKPGEFGSWGIGPYTDQLGPSTSDPNVAVDYALTPGSEAFKGFSPEIASNDYRDSFAGYVDFETSPVKGLDVGLAGRFEHYDDFGSTTTGKLSLRYEFTRNYAVRGTVSNGFRAPGLGQSHYAATTTQFQQDNGKLVSFQVGTFPVNSPVAQAFGATALQPEKSTNYSVGFVATPTRNLDITLDLYRIYVRHRINETGTIGAPTFPDPADPAQFQTGTYLTTLLENAGLDPTSAANTTVQYFTNAVDTRTQGVDFVAGYRTNFHEYGNVHWSLEANFNQTDVTAVAGLPPALQPIVTVPDYKGFELVDGPTQGFLTEATPRSKYIASALYTHSGWRVNLRETRYGHIVDTNAELIGGPVQRVNPMWITDLDVSYDLTERLTVGIGADNLLNQYPDKTSTDYQNAEGQGFGLYDPLTPAGYFGGFYYGHVAYHF